jgi:hypothetical protein
MILALMSRRLMPMIKRALHVLVAALCVLPSAAMAAEPTRQSLIEAWEAHMAQIPGTQAFEARGEDVYFIRDESLPYEGELRRVGVLVRPMDTVTEGAQFTHMGIVEFELPDFPVERMQYQSYYLWLEDRQNFYYSQADQAWLDSAAYRASFQDQMGVGSFRVLSFMLNYGIWILLIALIAFIFLVAGKQSRKARALMDDSASINQKARENLDRSEKLQDEMLGIANRTLEIQTANHELLKQILAAVRR